MEDLNILSNVRQPHFFSKWKMNYFFYKTLSNKTNKTNKTMKPIKPRKPRKPIHRSFPIEGLV
jgi:hypothetical protein